MESDITNPQTWGTKLTSVNIAHDLHNLCKQHNISLRSALEFGIKFLLAEKDEYAFERPHTKLQEKLERVIKQLSEKSQEYEDLKESLNKDDPKKDDEVEVNAGAEADNLFGGIKDE